jgi:hypothetical protein
MEKSVTTSEVAKQPYTRPQLVKQGRVEQITQDWLDKGASCPPIS